MAKRYRYIAIPLLFITTVATPLNAEESDSAQAKTEQKMEQIEEALRVFRKHIKRYPLGLRQLLIGASYPVKLSPLLRDEEEIKDGWGNVFVYQTNNGEESYRLISYGADGTRGGTGADADIIRRSMGFAPQPDQFDY